MNAIAWAIFCASLLIMPPRDRVSPNFEFNNAFDVCLFFIGFGMLIYWSFKT